MLVVLVIVVVERVVMVVVMVIVIVVIVVVVIVIVIVVVAVVVLVVVVVVVKIVVVVVVIVCRLNGKYNWGIKLPCLNAGEPIQPLLQTGVLNLGFRGLGTSSAHDRPTVTPVGGKG